MLETTCITTKNSKTQNKACEHLHYEQAVGIVDSKLTISLSIYFSIHSYSLKLDKIVHTYRAYVM